jgi:micrococcal nuclease
MKIMKKDNLLFIRLFLLLFLVLTISFSTGNECEYHYVKRVIDGDTFIIETGERVRLLGVDTPETVKAGADVEWFGIEASRRLKGWIEKRRVCLKRDSDITIDRDGYDRLLRYVWLDGLFINKELVLQGYAFAYTKHPFEYIQDFRRFEKIARKKGDGLWNREKKLAWERKYNKGLRLLTTCGKNGTICPWSAVRYIGKYKTVRFFVRKVFDAGDRIFLNSENDHRLEKNFTVMVIKSHNERRDEMEEMFLGRTVDVTGKIRLYDNRAEIVLKGLSGIRVVEEE